MSYLNVLSVLGNRKILGFLNGLGFLSILNNLIWRWGYLTTTFRPFLIYMPFGNFPFGLFALTAWPLRLYIVP